MATRLAIGLLALSLVACGARPAAVAAVTSPAPVTSSTASPAPSPRPTQRGLDIKLHLQEHSLTCEAAALKMALSFEGITIDEMTLLGYMTNDRRPAQLDAQGHLIA